MHAGLGNEGHLHFGILPPFPLKDPHPEMPCNGLRQRDGWIIVSVIFVPARQKAVIAAGALLQIDDHSIVAHSSPPGITLIQGYT
jgi:hypothetical protein